MKKIIFKYVLLIVVTFAASIFIYEYIQKSTAVDTEYDVLSYQKDLENQHLANTNYTLDNPNVLLNFYGNSPLTALVVFETKDLTSVTLTVKGKDGAADITHTFVPNKVHILPIYGLYPDYDNKVVITASGTSKEITIKTGALPDDFTKATYVSDMELEDGKFYFTTPEDKGYTAAYDENGEVRWYLTGDYKWDIQRLNNGHIIIGSDKLVSQPYYSIGLVEMDLLGKIYYEYNIPGGYHHNMIEFDNGNLLIASNGNNNTREDYIVEIDRATGNIVKEIDLNKILGGNHEGNWFGITSLAYDAPTNSLTVSGYHNDMIINIDYASTEINWIISKHDLGKFNKYKLDGDNLPDSPETVTLINSDEFVVTSLDGNKRALLTYKLDRVNKTFDITNKITLDDNENAYIDKTDEGYLVTQGNNILRVNDSSTERLLSINSTLYNTKLMPLYANDIYTGVQGTRLGVLGETPTTSNHLLIWAKEDESIIDKYNLNFYKDVYGLRFAGTFSKDDDVQLILDNVLSKKTYDIQIPDSDEEKIVTSKYVNEDEIKGKYYIFIRINGTIYKLNKYVIFY